MVPGELPWQIAEMRDGPLKTFLTLQYYKPIDFGSIRIEFGGFDKLSSVEKTVAQTVLTTHLASVSALNMLANFE